MLPRRDFGIHSSALGSSSKVAAGHKNRDVLCDPFNSATRDFVMLAARRDTEAAPHNITLLHKQIHRSCQAS